jgi:hypothetical protein
MWVEEEVQQRPTVRDLTGLLLETGGGVAVTLLAHRAISVHLSVPSQALANSVLATLCGKSCLPSACYNGELLTRDWGDVRSIRVMRARCEPAAIHISLDTLYDTTLDCTTGTAH